MQVDCKICSHVGVCAVRQKMQEQITMEFPDGARAVFDMEQAIILCDHFNPTVAQPIRQEPSTVPEDTDDTLASDFTIGQRSPETFSEEATYMQVEDSKIGISQAPIQPSAGAEVFSGGSEISSSFADVLASSGLGAAIGPVEPVRANRVGARKGTKGAVLERTPEGRIKINLRGLGG